MERVRGAGVEMLPFDLDLVKQCSVILSVVPPRDAEATAQRIIDALSGGTRSEPLYFLDLNAISPSTARGISSSFDKARVPVRFIDGCIIGGPPRSKTTPDAGTNVTTNPQDESSGWYRPNLPVSGPHTLSSLVQGDRLSSVLNLDVISPDIGQASGLKMCFAAMSKGFTALATQAFTTAHKLGVADALRGQLAQLNPGALAAAEKGVPSMIPKAYRWVREMEEIASTMSDDGGWDRELFDGVAGVYRAIAEDGVLKAERTGKRSRGTSVDDVAELLADGLEKKKKKME